MNRFKTKRIDMTNIISFTCSDEAMTPVLGLLEAMKSMSDGQTRTVSAEDYGIWEFDGDGSAQLANINVNGLPLKDWKKIEDESEKVGRELWKALSENK
jgi:hypothetical protein